MVGIGRGRGFRCRTSVHGLRCGTSVHGLLSVSYILDAFFDTCKMIEIFARYMNNYMLLSTRPLVSLRRLTVRRPAFALPIVN